MRRNAPFDTKSGLSPQRPKRLLVVAAKSKTDSPGSKQGGSRVNRERHVKFQNTETGKYLSGILLQAEEGKRAAILCHGFASHKNGFHFPAIAESLSHRNVSSLRFDFSGNGDSEGSFEFGNYATEAKDVRSAVQYLEKSGYTVVALVGHSKGGNSVLLYASVYDDVPNVVNVAGRYDLTRGITERFGNDILSRLAQDKQIDMELARDDGVIIEWTLTKWSLQDRLDTDMRAAAAKIRVSEVLTVHGSADKVIPVDDAHRWGAVIANHQLTVIEGAGHSFRQHTKPMISAVVEHCTV